MLRRDLLCSLPWQYGAFMVQPLRERLRLNCTRRSQSCMLRRQLPILCEAFGSSIREWSNLRVRDGYRPVFVIYPFVVHQKQLVLNSNDTAIVGNSAVGPGHRIFRRREFSATAGWQCSDLDLSKRYKTIRANRCWHLQSRTLARPGSMACHRCPAFHSSLIAVSYSGRVCGLGASRIPGQRCSPFACRGRRVSIQVSAFRLTKDVFIRRIRMGQGPLLLLFRKGYANIA